MRALPLSILVPLGLLLFAACAGEEREVRLPTPVPAEEQVAPDPALAPPSPHQACLERGFHADTLRFGSGDTLLRLLGRAGIAQQQLDSLVQALGCVFDMGEFRSGRELHLFLDDEGNCLGLDYPLDFDRDLCAWRRGESYGAAVLGADIEWRVRKIAAVLETSFFAALSEQGENADLATRIADLFAGEIDFILDLRPGDRMDLLVESATRPDRRRPRDRVLCARLQIGDEVHEAFLYPDPDGNYRYFHEDGSSLERQFLKAPVKYARMSSGFTRSRLHPILGFERPHNGVDYAAPIGTPIHATADGTVAERKHSPQAGRYLTLRHPGGIETRYLHMRSYAEGTAVGKRVKKGQVIGYIGMTGLTTGPHVCYRMRVDGKYVDARRYRSRPQPALAQDERQEFDSRVAGYRALWNEVLSAGL